MSRMGGDATTIKYRAIGSTVTSDGSGYMGEYRPYIVGNATSLVSVSGPSIASFYSSGKFLPGTRIRWEPTVNATTNGRIYIGFSDNPEVLTTFLATGASGRNAIVKGLGTVMSFPVWQETDIDFPARLRRKMFDVNSTVSGVDTYDRSLQTCFFIGGEGLDASKSYGSFVYDDHVFVEGVQNVAT